MSTPITTLTLYRTDLVDDGNVMDYETHTTYIGTLAQTPDLHYTITGCTFQRQNRNIRLPLSMDIAGRYNYGSFVNNGRTFYIFITNMEYVNDNMTSASYTMDWWHTYQRDIQYKPTMIERKIVPKADDLVGRYTADEGISPSTYTITDSWSNYTGVTIPEDLAYWYLLIDNGYGVFEPPSHNYGGYQYLGNVKMSDGIDVIKARLTSITNLNNNSETIQGVWCLPKAIFGDEETDILDEPHIGIRDVSVNLPTSVGGYTIKNKKCLVAPFTIVNAASSDGTDITIHPQDIIENEDDTELMFSLTVAVFPTPSAEIRPSYVFQTPNNFSQMSLICQHFPVPAITTATITMKDTLDWSKTALSVSAGLVMTEGQMALTAGNKLASLKKNKHGGGGILTKADKQRYDALDEINEAQGIGNVGGAVLNSMEKAAQITGIHGFKSTGSGTSLARGSIGFVINVLAADREQMIAIDNYFSRYGYIINQIENIQLHNRIWWDYVKTRDASLSVPAAPVEAQDAINRMFDNGLTVWHTSSYFKQFNMPNN